MGLWERTLTLTLNFPLPSIVFHNEVFVFIMIFTDLSFFRLTHGFFLHEVVMSVRLYESNYAILVTNSVKVASYFDSRMSLGRKNLCKHEYPCQRRI